MNLFVVLAQCFEWGQKQSEILQYQDETKYGAKYCIEKCYLKTLNEFDTKTAV